LLSPIHIPGVLSFTNPRYTAVYIWYIKYTVDLLHLASNVLRKRKAESNVKRDAGPAGFKASVGQAHAVEQVGFIVVVIRLPPMTHVSRPMPRSEAR
jgi:hypothetical protein